PSRIHDEHSVNGVHLSVASAPITRDETAARARVSVESNFQKRVRLLARDATGRERGQVELQDVNARGAGVVNVVFRAGDPSPEKCWVTLIAQAGSRSEVTPSPSFEGEGWG